MPDERFLIPLADVLRAANELVSAGLIRDYALGGALAAIYYTEPVTTYDADIIFVASDKSLSVGIPEIYARLQSKGWRVEREHLLVKDFPVQFIAASGLTEEAVREAKGELSAQLIDHLKKADMAKEAERLLDGSGWLPEPLRLAVPARRERRRWVNPLPEFLADDEDRENAGI